MGRGLLKGIYRDVPEMKGLQKGIRRIFLIAVRPGKGSGRRLLIVRMLSKES
jgi:hypothetical protein